jgi:hypothetical protein
VKPLIEQDFDSLRNRGINCVADLTYDVLMVELRNAFLSSAKDMVNSRDEGEKAFCDVLSECAEHLQCAIDLMGSADFANDLYRDKQVQPTATVKDWGFTVGCEKNSPPECRFLVLYGTVIDHTHKSMVGKHILTSRVVSSKGRLVTTKNTAYTLEGPPCAGYVEALKEKGMSVSADDPINDVLALNYGALENPYKVFGTAR